MAIYNLIFTLDYEIHGNGDGSPYELMIEPTNRLMKMLEKYGYKLTIMADIAEILCFKKYFEVTGNDLFFYKKIVNQLQDAVRRGHDVQLHIHSSYFKSTFNGKSWQQYWPEYNMAALSYDRINEMTKTSVQFLEDTLKPISSDYKCHVFRAANWSMMPTPEIYKALVNNGIKIDTSVYKGGSQFGNVSYDYSRAYSQIFPYTASNKDINQFDPDGKLIEYPIYTEMRYFWSFITPIRLFRIIRAKFHQHKKPNLTTLHTIGQEKKSPNSISFMSFWIKSPWKFDFNQASGFQLINAMKRINKKVKSYNSEVDIVLIGHSKTFILYNEKTLEKFLCWSVKQKNIKFGIFKLKR